MTDPDPDGEIDRRLAALERRLFNPDPPALMSVRWEEAMLRDALEGGDLHRRIPSLVNVPEWARKRRP